MVYGKTEPVFEEEPDIMAYFRRGEKKTLLVIGNFDKKERSLPLPESGNGKPSVLLNNGDGFEVQDGNLILEPYQALVLDLS